MTIMTAEIGVCIPAASTKPPTTIRNVATKPKTVAPFGNKMLAVFTGLGQRRMLLRPLIKKRQPRMVLNISSAIGSQAGVSNAILGVSMLKRIDANIVRRWTIVNGQISYLGAGFGQICLDETNFLVVFSLENT